MGDKTGKVDWDKIVSVLHCQTKEYERILEAIGNRSHDPEARKENCGSDLVPAHDQDPGIGVEAGIVG